mmetsp:Transcript_53323/g.172076  ORF Transcript_53323/g.172076 Transcript_53323/m.172076 type:complete len:187 (+) Transcript_53323:518-1078(+)
MAQHRMTARSCEVDYDCVLASIKALGLSAKKSEVRAAMRELGACPETGALDFDMFSELMQRVYASRDPLDAMLASFRLFDPAGHGRINIKATVFRFTVFLHLCVESGSAADRGRPRPRRSPPGGGLGPHGAVLRPQRRWRGRRGRFLADVVGDLVPVSAAPPALPACVARLQFDCSIGWWRCRGLL